MIKNIIFDMGNVLIYFDRDYFLDAAGVTDPKDRQLLMREVYLSLEWSRMDRGSLTENEATEIFLSRVPERLHEKVKTLVGEWDRPILPVPGMADLIGELKTNGYGIYLLSNASLRQHEYWPRVPGCELFDGALVSADVKLVKPQTEIYALLCDKFSIKPEESIFVDDSTPNVEAAFFFGMNGVVFHNDVDELRNKLRDFGVEI